MQDTAQVVDMEEVVVDIPLVHKMLELRLDMVEVEGMSTEQV